MAGRTRAAGFLSEKKQVLFRGTISGLLLLTIPLVGRAQANTELFRYLSPLPGSSLVSPGTNVIVRYIEEIDGSGIHPDLLQVRGTKSGLHAGRTIISSDGSLIFRPYNPFLPGEQVEVRLHEGLHTIGGAAVPGLSFGFHVSGTSPEIRHQYVTEFTGAESVLTPQPDPDGTALCDTFPAGYPAIDLLVQNDPDPGYLFVSPFPGSGVAGHMMILDNQAVPLFYRKMPAPVTDLKKHPDGRLTYYDFRVPRKYFVMDSSYTVVDSIQSGNGYPMTDGHELLLPGNGNIILMIYDIQTIRMDTIVAGGDSAAQVVGLVLQEMDPDRNVIFQWRSWDHFSIFDGEVSEYVVLDSNWIDYVHGNSIEIDDDGNWIVSSRHMNEITKIDRGTGEIIWRLGRNAVNNDFTFINDPRGFSHQHDARRLQNGNLTLFDNGNFLDPEYSRALEYDLDEVNMTATLVWEYRNSPDAYGAFMGSVRRSPTGKSLIGWGGTFSPPGLTEVNSDGSRAIELGFPAGSFSYRAYRFDWRTNMFTTSADSMDFGVVAPGDSSLRSLNIGNNSATALTITCLTNTDTAFAANAALPIVIPPFSSVGLTVRFAPPADGDYVDHLYIRSVADTTLVAQRVVLTGTTMPTPVAESEEQPLEFRLEQNYPNPFNPSTTITFTISQSSNINLSIYDLVGRRVTTLVDEKLGPGRYTRVWDATGYPSGVYFYRLMTDSFVQTRTLVLLR